MKKGDFVWLVVLLAIILVLVLPQTHMIFITLTSDHPYIGGFIKFAILATMGELLAIRISKGDWKMPFGLIYRSLIWGFLGMVIVLIFSLYALGVKSSMANGMLPGGESKLAFAFAVGALLNLTFAPTMMAFHRITDTYIDLRYEKNDKVTVKQVVERIDWNGFISFVVLKTISFFWIPAHTLTFLLPAEYRVLVAAGLSIALGGILAFAKKKENNN